jgi:hypothetical protein
MRFEIKRPSKENIYTLMRKAGYPTVPLAKRRRKKKDELEFARPARGYPRFHLFIKTKNNTLIFNLHLDQKKPIYESAPAHAGEYDSDVVVKEAERIKQTLSN